MSSQEILEDYASSSDAPETSPKKGTVTSPKVIPAAAIRKGPKNPDANRPPKPIVPPIIREPPIAPAQVKKARPYGDRGVNDPPTQERYKTRSKFKVVGDPVHNPSPLRSRGYAVVPRTEEELEEADANRPRYGKKHFGRSNFGVRKRQSKKAKKTKKGKGKRKV